MRARRARRDATRDAIDARRECTRRCVILYATSDARRDWNRTTRPRSRSRRASRASNARIERNVFSTIRSRSRASRPVPPRVDGTTRRGAARARAGGPRCAFFASPPAKIFVHPDVSGAIDGASRGLPRWMCPRVARGSRTQGFAVRPRDRVDDKHPASIGDAVSRDADADADADATRVESRGCANARIHSPSSRRARVERISRVTVREPVHRGWVPDRGLCSSRERVPIPRVGGYIHGSRPVVFGFDFSHFFCPNQDERSLRRVLSFFLHFAFASRASSAHGVARTADDRREPRSGSIAKEFDRREPAECAPRTRSRVDATDA